MNRRKSGIAIMVGAVLLTVSLAIGASAQVGMIEAGTTIKVRTTEDIKATDTEGKAYRGVVDQDVRDRNGTLVIPKAADADLVVKRISDNEIALDLNAITVNGQRYSIESENAVASSDRKEGIGANKRTGKYVGGGAVVGAIIGAIAGGGKGAAIGAGAGAAAGAGVQVLTRGSGVDVPAESLLTFRLQQPMYTTASARLKPQYGADYTSSAAYRAGLTAGQADRDRNLPRNARSPRWTSAQDRRDYEAGYNSGYSGEVTAGDLGYGKGRIHIGSDNNITWQAPSTARVFVRVDNNPEQLFAEAPSGSQSAAWIEPGHVYVFMLRDMNGNEIARDRLDLRAGTRYRR